MAEEECTIHLHLIGRQGSGKSSTGNTILKRKKFTLKSNTDPEYAVTTNLTSSGDNVCLWDWPGTDGTKQTSEKIAQDLGRKLSEAPPETISIITWLLRYGELCGQEEKEFLSNLDKHLGDTVKKQSIILITSMDNFFRDFEDEEITFESWVDEQTGVFDHLRKMFHGRVLGFDNMNTGHDQIKMLQEMIDNLISERRKEHPSSKHLEGTPLVTSRQTSSDPRAHLQFKIKTFIELMAQNEERRKPLEDLLSDLRKFDSQDVEIVRIALRREVEKELKRISVDNVTTIEYLKDLMNQIKPDD